MRTSVAVAFARAVVPGRALNLMIDWTTMVTDAAKAAADAAVSPAAVATATMCSRDNSFSARWCRCARRTALASSNQMQPRGYLGLVRSCYCRRRRRRCRRRRRRRQRRRRVRMRSRTFPARALARVGKHPSALTPMALTPLAASCVV